MYVIIKIGPLKAGKKSYGLMSQKLSRLMEISKNVIEDKILKILLWSFK